LSKLIEPDNKSIEPISETADRLFTILINWSVVFLAIFIAFVVPTNVAQRNRGLQKN
jgi:hypothetical protein